jgi:dextranase
VIELLPTKATFASDQPVEVEVRGADGPTVVSLWQLARQVDEVVVPAGSRLASFGPLPEGGYGVEVDGLARTALDVQGRPMRRLRYGFVSDFAAGRAVEGVTDNVRRLHLNAVQFYDWMYRHARLLPPNDEFHDALGRAVSLDTVRRLTRAVREAGSHPLGYAAVYAVGGEDRAAWADEALCHADGSWWMLADFLWIVDPSSDRWLRHLTSELAAAQQAVGFDGFHLDQYGAPKRATRRDGTVVDLADAFPVLIDRVREALPEAVLMFNNVNDFPTWSTAGAPQDAVYVEVWPPHDRLEHLAGLVATGRARIGKPVVLAAYPSSYRRGEVAAMELELATVFSHGGTCLLHGEEDAILVDPYYVRHAHMDAEAVDASRALYDFAVRYGDLLFDPELVDVTRSHVGGVNKEIAIEAAVPVATDAIAGAVWARALVSDALRVVSLIDLSAQEGTEWDAPRVPGNACDGTVVSFERAGLAPRIYLASAAVPRALELEATLVDGRDVVRLPSWETWALVWAES